jgi:hypothetical protein
MYLSYLSEKPCRHPVIVRVSEEVKEGDSSKEGFSLMAVGDEMFWSWTPAHLKPAGNIYLLYNHSGPIETFQMAALNSNGLINRRTRLGCHDGTRGILSIQES